MRKVKESFNDESEMAREFYVENETVSLKMLKKQDLFYENPFTKEK